MESISKGRAASWKLRWFYNSVPVSLDNLALEARKSVVAIYDMDWRQKTRRESTPHKVFTGRDSMWIAVNSVLLDPGRISWQCAWTCPVTRSVGAADAQCASV